MLPKEIPGGGYIKVELSGRHTASRTLPVPSGDQRTEFSFSDIPVGSYRIAAALYDGSGTVQYSGSERVTVRSGTNSVHITMARVDNTISTKTVLYQYGGNEWNFYLSDSAGASLSGTPTIQAAGSDNRVNSFAFDKDGNLYVLQQPASGGPATIVSSKEGFGSVSIADTDLTAIAIDRKTNTLYGLHEDTLFAFPRLISDKDSGEKQHYELTLDSPWSGLLSVFAVYDDVLYLPLADLADIGTNYHATISLIKADLAGAPEAGDYFEPKFSPLLDTADLGQFGAPSITDCLYQNGAVYVLVRDYESHPSGDSKFYSRGAVIAYDISSQKADVHFWTETPIPNTGKYVYAVTKEDVPKHFYTKQETDTSRDKLVLKADEIRGSNSASNFAIYAPAYPARSALYGPQKFIALGPKKLVIADDGIAFYTDSNGAFVYKNVNRVITVDLETFALSSAEASCTFDSESEAEIIASGSTYTEKTSLYEASTKFSYFDASNSAAYTAEPQLYYDGASSYGAASAFSDSGNHLLPGIPLRE